MRRSLVTALSVLLLAGCGPVDTGTESSTPDPRDTTPAGEAVVVSIAIRGGKVTPQGDRVQVRVGQKVTLRITSDAHDTIHLHSEPEREFEVRSGDEIEKSFTFDVPGQIAVEAHHLDATIVQLVVSG